MHHNVTTHLCQFARQRKVAEEFGLEVVGGTARLLELRVPERAEGAP